MNPEEGRDDEELKDAIAEQLQALPKAVQDFVTGPERSRVALSLTQKYGLHVDQADAFDVALLHMLLGVSTPEEFTAELSDAGIPQGTVAALANDVNNEVFIRLRDAEREATQGVSEQAESASRMPLPPPSIAYQPPISPTLPGSPVPELTRAAPAISPEPVAVAPTVPAIPGVAPLPQAIVPTEIATLEPTPQSVPVQQMAHAMPQALHQPGWHPAAAVHIFVPTQGPASYQQQAPQPAPVPEQVYAPVPPPPAPLPVPPAPVTPTVATPPPAPMSEVSIPIKKDYAADPYREPIQ